MSNKNQLLLKLWRVHTHTEIGFIYINLLKYQEMIEKVLHCKNTIHMAYRYGM